MLNLYTEVAAQAAPATPASVIKFALPRQNGTLDRSKASSSTDSHIQNEEDYSSNHLASAGNIYFRTSKAHQPRCILWRLIGEQRVLELFPADLSTSEDDTKEAHLTLRFAFQDPILPAGIAITDSDAESEINVFVCTTTNELFHLLVVPDAFRTHDAISEDTGQWCKAVNVSTLAIQTVFRIHAHTPYELVISYTNGMVQRLRRKTDSNIWIPENYNDQKWGASIRGIVGKSASQTVDYRSKKVDTRAVQAMQISADSNHLFTVCLNHQLRIWHLASGRLVVATDLLNQARETNERVHLNPAEAGHLQLYKLDHMKHSMLITYSPHEAGQFKFWDVKGGITGPLSAEDRYPQLKLSPPDPDPTGNTIWSMAGFRVVPCAVDPTNSVRIWVLWRNNNHHQIYTTRFVLSDADRSWKSEWVSCVPSASKKPSPPDHVKSSPDDVTAQWLDYLLYPGRYTPAVLDTALSIYSEALATKALTLQSTSGIKVRLCSVIAAGVALRKYDQSILDFDRFATDTDLQWRNFSKIVENVNDGRLAPLALAFDLFHAEPWVIMADKCCAIRECNNLELVTLNEPSELEDAEEVCETLWAHRKVEAVERGVSYENLANLTNAAESFRKDFSSELAYKLEVSIEEDLLVNAEETTSSQILEIYDNTGFGDAVSDDAFHRLQRDFKPLGELEQLNGEIVLAILDVQSTVPKLAAGHLKSTVFGLNILANGTLDVMTAMRQVLWDLLVLIVFVEGELNQDEEKMSSFDAAEIFTRIITELRILDRNLWLATHSRAVAVDFPDAHRRLQEPPNTQSVPDKDSRVVSILEDSIWKAIKPRPVAEVPNSYLLTETLHEIVDWAASGKDLGFENGTVYSLCDLIVHNEIELASDFLRFLPSSPWATYFRGRLYLRKNEHDQASQYFRQSAYGLACGKAVGELNPLSAGLLLPHEVDSFNNGMPRYLQHILSLFEEVYAYPQAITFAKLALEALLPGQKEGSDMRSEILSRLFTAQVQTSSFQPAFDTLVQFPDQALQKSCATILIEAILDVTKSQSSIAGAVRTLQSLPWSLSPLLSRHLDSQLSLLAKRQKTIGPDLRSFTFSKGKVDYISVVHALRIARRDYHGAVEVLYDRLRLVQKSGRVRSDPSMKGLRYALMSLINAMTMLAPDEAYILAESDEPSVHVNGVNGEALNNGKRRKVVITLDDLRRDYQRVLDRCARVERGDFDFGETEDDSEEDSDIEMRHSTLNHNGSLVRRDDRMEL